MLLEQAPAFALVVGERQQEHLGRDELVAALLRFLVGEVEQIGQIAPDLHFAAVAFHLGQARHGVVQRRLQRVDVAAGTGQQRTRPAVGIVEQSQQQVLRLDELVVVADGQALGIGQGLLQFGREFVETHGALLNGIFDCSGTWGMLQQFQPPLSFPYTTPSFKDMYHAPHYARPSHPRQCRRRSGGRRLRPRSHRAIDSGTYASTCHRHYARVSGAVRNAVVRRMFPDARPELQNQLESAGRRPRRGQPDLVRDTRQCTGNAHRRTSGAEFPADAFRRRHADATLRRGD